MRHESPVVLVAVVAYEKEQPAPIGRELYVRRTERRAVVRIVDHAVRVEIEAAVSSLHDVQLGQSFAFVCRVGDIAMIRTDRPVVNVAIAGELEARGMSAVGWNAAIEFHHIESIAG